VDDSLGLSIGLLYAISIESQKKQNNGGGFLPVFFTNLLGEE